MREDLEDRYADNVSLTQLSRMLDRTPAHLVRVFSAEIGLPPHRYQTQVNNPHLHLRTAGSKMKMGALSNPDLSILRLQHR